MQHDYAFRAHGPCPSRYKELSCECLAVCIRVESYHAQWPTGPHRGGPPLTTEPVRPAFRRFDSDTRSRWAGPEPAGLGKFSSEAVDSASALGCTQGQGRHYTEPFQRGKAPSLSIEGRDFSSEAVDAGRTVRQGSQGQGLLYTASEPAAGGRASHRQHIRGSESRLRPRGGPVGLGYGSFTLQCPHCPAAPACTQSMAIVPTGP